MVEVDFVGFFGVGDGLPGFGVDLAGGFGLTGGFVTGGGLTRKGGFFAGNFARASI